MRFPPWPNAAKIAEFLHSEAQALSEIGDKRGSNVHLIAAIALRRELLRLAASADERVAARNDLGNALLGRDRLFEPLCPAGEEQRMLDRSLASLYAERKALGELLARSGGRRSWNGGDHRAAG
jgi:hypothetical protein